MAKVSSLTTGKLLFMINYLLNTKKVQWVVVINIKIINIKNTDYVKFYIHCIYSFLSCEIDSFASEYILLFFYVRNNLSNLFLKKESCILANIFKLTLKIIHHLLLNFIAFFLIAMLQSFD